MHRSLSKTELAQLQNYLISSLYYQNEHTKFMKLVTKSDFFLTKTGVDLDKLASFLIIMNIKNLVLWYKMRIFSSKTGLDNKIQSMLIVK